MSKTLCLHCQKYLHADCKKCNLPQEYRLKLMDDKPVTQKEKIYGWFGGLAGK